MVLLNGGLYWQLNRLSKVDQFASASNELKNFLFKARLTNLIALIFICAQVAFVIDYSLYIVSLFSFVYYQSLEIICLFQFLNSRETRKKFHENPLEWKTLYKFWAYMNPIMIICRLLNCSLNFYVYKFLRHRNKKAEIRRRQKRQQDREMVNLRKANTTDPSNEQTA